MRPVIGSSARRRIATMRATLLAASLLLPAVHAQVAPPSKQDAIRAIERYLESCELFGWSGVALVVRDDEIVLHRGYGLADRVAGVPNGPDIVFEIASTTKPFTACAILALVEDGKVALDDSIADYLPGVPDDKRGITVRHLLAHTSGMPRTAGGGGGDDLARAVAGYLAPARVREPGAKHEYWNGGYALLAGIVETVTEGGYSDYCAKRVFASAGLRATGFTGDAIWPAAKQAVGYAGGAPVRRAAEHAYGGAYGYQYRGMGGMVTTAEELWRLTRAVMDGKVVDAKTVEQMVTVVDGSYGLGWARTNTRRNTTRIGHGGDVRGFHTQLDLFPDEDAAVVLLSNVDEVPMGQLAGNVEALLLGGKPPYPLPPQALEVTPKSLARCAGGYELGDGVEIVTVRATERGLAVSGEGLAAKALLSGAPALSGTPPQLASMISVIEAVAAGDPGPVEAVLAEGIHRTWPTTLTTLIYPKHVETWGKLQTVTPLDFREPRTGMAEGVFALDHERGRAHVRVVYMEGRLTLFDLKAAASVGTWCFAPSVEGARGKEPGHFVTYRWETEPPRAGGASPSVTLRFEPIRGAVKALVLERSGAEPVRLERAK
jgi:CubicO group peptidase (beta-lactamase class C family)